MISRKAGRPSARNASRVSPENRTIMTTAELLEQPFSTMPDMIRAHAKERPQHRAIIDGERVLTFAEFDALIDRAAAAMQRDGAGNKGAVAICSPSSIEYVTVFVAALR